MTTTTAPEQATLAGIEPPREPEPDVDAMLWVAVIGYLVNTPRVVTPTHDVVYLECELRQHNPKHRGAKNLIANLKCTEGVAQAEQLARELRVGHPVVVHGTGLEDTTYRGAPVHKLVRTHYVLPYGEAERIHQPPTAAAAATTP